MVLGSATRLAYQHLAGIVRDEQQVPVRPRDEPCTAWMWVVCDATLRAAAPHDCMSPTSRSVTESDAVAGEMVRQCFQVQRRPSEPMQPVGDGRPPVFTTQVWYLRDRQMTNRCDRSSKTVACVTKRGLVYRDHDTQFTSTSEPSPCVCQATSACWSYQVF